MPSKPEQLKQILKSTSSESIHLVTDILYYNMRYEENERAIISTVNLLLSAVKTRSKGFSILNKILPHCSLAALTEHAIFWVSRCVVQHSYDEMKEIELHTLANIVSAAKGIESFNKKFVSDYMGETLKMCLNADGPTQTITSLKCLTQCMQQFPPWFGNHRNRVEEYLLKFLEDPTEHVVKQAALAFHYLQQTGGAGVNSINYKENFSTQLNKICATVHSLYDILFESVNEINHTEKIEVDAIRFDPIPSNFDSEKYLDMISCRIRNCIIFIKMMLIKKFPTVKKIIPEYIVGVVNRGLNPHICLQQDEISLEKNFLSLQVNKIQVHLLELLHHFIMGYSHNVLPYSYFITKMLIMLTKRIQNCDCFAVNMTFRKMFYKLLNTCLLLKFCNKLQLQVVLIPLLLKEITPPKMEVLLRSNALKKKKSRKMKEIASNSDNKSSTELHNINNFVRENSRINALQALKTMCCMLTCSQTVLKELISSILNILGDIQANRIVSVHVDADSQTMLYEILVALLEQDTSNMLPLNLVTHVLNGGINNTYCKISQVCNEGLRIVEKVSQPLSFSLHVFEHEKVQKQVHMRHDLDVEVSESVSSCVLGSEINGSNNLQNSAEQSYDELDDTNVNLDEEKVDKTLPEKEKHLNDVAFDRTSLLHNISEDEIEECSTEKQKESEISNRGLEELLVSEDKDLNDTKFDGSSSFYDALDESEEPPAKKQKESSEVGDNSLEEMLVSFQDVIQ